MSATVTKGVRQKHIEKMEGNPSPLLMLYGSVLNPEMQLLSVSIETARGLDASTAATIVDYYSTRGWTMLHINPRPDGFTALVAPTRDIKPEILSVLNGLIRYDRKAPLKKLLKRLAFLKPGEYNFHLTQETVESNGWSVELPFGNFRTIFETSQNQVNDGHASVKRSSAVKLLATALSMTKPKPFNPLAKARRLLKTATHIQLFFTGTHGCSKGLHVIRKDEDFERAYGPDVDAVSDAENRKGEMWLAPGHFTGKINIWRPRGRRSTVLTASEDLRRRLSVDVIGRDQSLSLHRAAFQQLLAETRQRITDGQPFDHEESMLASWTQEIYDQQRLYNSDQERGIASQFPWTGSIYPKLYGGIGAFTTQPGARVPIQGIMCILGGDGHHYGVAPPPKGYVSFVSDEDAKPYSLLVNPDDYAAISHILDTSDNDGDLGVVVPAQDPEGYVSEDTSALWAMILRTPASPGGVAWLRLDQADWNRLCEAGAMPVTVNGPVPYKDFMVPGDDGQLPVHTLRPIGDMRAAEAWDTTAQSQVEEAIHIRNQAALIGVFYRVMTAAHNADILRMDTPEWLETMYAQHGMEPSTTGGASTCFSDYVDSVGKLLTPPIDAMAEILCQAAVEHGVRHDRCSKDSLWQPMFSAFSRTTDWSNQQIAQTLNAAFTTNCMGDHFKTTQSITASTNWFEKEMTKLQLMSNGPASLLMADPEQFPGELVARISAVQQRITRLWAAKFAADRQIDEQTRQNQDDQEWDEYTREPQDQPSYESWELLSEQQAAAQKAQAYRHTANHVARLIAESIQEAAEEGHMPVSYVAAWIRLVALSTNRFGAPKNGYRQNPQPPNTTTLFRAISLLQREDEATANEITSLFQGMWPGNGPTALLRLSDPGAIVPGERAEIRLNSSTGDYMLCRNGTDPVCRVTSGAQHFLNLPLTYAGQPKPLDPTGDSTELQDLHLFLIHSVYPQTVSLTPADEPEFAKDEEVTVVRASSATGPAYSLATTRKHLEKQLKGGRQAVIHEMPLEGIQELHLGRTFKYAGTANNGNVLLRQEHRKRSKSERLVDSIMELLLQPAS